MSESHAFVIVGAALAGASAAETLRAEGFEGPVVLIGAEEHAPYIRPPLSKEYLSGKDELDTVFVHPEEWYAEQNISLRQGSHVASIDREHKRVRTTTGEIVNYNKLLLTTGASPRRLDVPGDDLEGVHYLRTIEDSTALRAVIADGGKRVVVIGSGWIGLEVAATAKTLGNEVTVLDHGGIPLAKALGDELGEFFAKTHEDNGVVLRRNVSVAAIDGDLGRASGVILSDGEVVPADLVVVGIGATPNVELAEAAGLLVDNGILVDETLVTDDPDIYAAGDVANPWHPVIEQRLRSEHWANALNTGPVAAKSMLGQSVVYDDIPYVYTDQFDIGMEYSGYAPLAVGAQVVYRGDVAKREFIAFWVSDGKVVAGMNVNVWDVNEDVQGIIKRANTVDVAKLADPDVDLKSL